MHKGEENAFTPGLQRIGRIVAVTGGRAVIMLDTADASGQEPESPEIGTLLKVETEETIALALVSGLSTPMPEADNDQGGDVRIVEVEFIGELAKDENGQPRSFRRGVSQYPGLGGIVCLATRKELQMAYACDAASSIKVGTIHQDKSIPAMVKLDDMLGKHFAILGTTGTGKSCSVALILRRILEKNPNAHILLLDVHREYAAAFSDLAEVISPESLNLPFWLLNFEEICEVLVGKHSQSEVDTEILRDLIPQAKARYKNATRKGQSALLKARESVDAQNIGADTPLPYRASDLFGLLDEYIGKLDMKGNLAPFKRIKARLDAVTRDPRYAFMFGSLTVHDSMAEVLGRLFRIPVNGRPITILELGGLPSEVINVVVSVLARLAFDFGLYSSGQVPITFVCEEAHRYVPFDPNAGFEPTKRAISRIAKEGRKYGVSLCIITQRPAELDPTILSQCNTIFSLRLTNERDQEILKAGISDSAASLMDFMPTMGVGEAVTFGEGVSLPTRIKFDLLPPEHLPKSSTALFSVNWRNDITEPNFLKHIVARWRHQNLGPDGMEADIPAGMDMSQEGQMQQDFAQPMMAGQPQGIAQPAAQMPAQSMPQMPPAGPAAQPAAQMSTHPAPQQPQGARPAPQPQAAPHQVPREVMDPAVAELLAKNTAGQTTATHPTATHPTTPHPAPAAPQPASAQATPAQAAPHPMRRAEDRQPLRGAQPAPGQPAKPTATPRAAASATDPAEEARQKLRESLSDMMQQFRNQTGTGK